MISVGIIGYGYWGPNLVRNFAELPNVSVRAVSDLDSGKLAAVGRRYPAVTATTDVRDLLNDAKLDAVVVATPVRTHYELALAALQAGKHVWVEKPMTETSEQAARLIEEAERRGLVLSVDHTFVYTGAVRKIAELIASGELGTVYYYDSIRVNLGLIQQDVNVISDLAVHDFSILDYVLREHPVAVSANGLSHFRNTRENLAYISLFYASGTIAHINVNWLAPVKVRQTLVGGSKKMIVYDDLEPSEKIKIYDKGVTFTDDPAEIYQMRIGYRTGDMWAPKLDMTEALSVEGLHFVECIEQSKPPATGGHAGYRVVKLIEAANASIRQRGATVELSSN